MRAPQSWGGMGYAQECVERARHRLETEKDRGGGRRKRESMVATLMKAGLAVVHLRAKVERGREEKSSEETGGDGTGKIRRDRTTHFGAPRRL